MGISESKNALKSFTFLLFRLTLKGIGPLSSLAVTGLWTGRLTARIQCGIFRDVGVRLKIITALSSNG